MSIEDGDYEAEIQCHWAVGEPLNSGSDNNLDEAHLSTSSSFNN
jgi:hypothetical protein